MDRRQFLQRMTAGAAIAENAWTGEAPQEPAVESDTSGHTLVSEFQHQGASWKVYEDLRSREGAITLVSSRGARRVMPKRVEAVFPEAETPYLGLDIAEIGRSGPDLLADKLLLNGDPDPAQVKAAAPPLGSPRPAPPPGTTPAPAFAANPRPVWSAIVGNKESFDTMVVFTPGNTRTYHTAAFPELSGVRQHYDGMLGGWMPAVVKVFPISDTAYVEMIVFGDVEATDKFIVQTWHRTTRIENGKAAKVVYGHTYPSYPPGRLEPQPEEFYRALLVFADYWDRQLHDFAPASLPHNVWIDMSKHAFAKELMVRPGGYYPRYGAYDRDYAGSEYDGFQDIFTSAVYTNLEWGRFEQAKIIIDNYLTDFTDAKGMINMRGPETAQFGMTLMLMARYFNYTQDSALILKHRGKIEATAALLESMHDISLKLPRDDPGHGLIAGWSESDACLTGDGKIWWQPYFANSAFAARGLKDIALAWQDLNKLKPMPGADRLAQSWLQRSKTLQDATVKGVEKSVRRDLNPPYVGILPGQKLTFRESMQQERPSPQQWPHRPYAELLQADVLPPELANLTMDCMRAYGATTLGVLANVGRGGSRAILGFIAYGHAQMLLRMDRVEEFLLFLYSHRYHDHTPGTWTAGEVAGITGGTATFCIPAQQTIPMLVRWMLVLEDSDEDRIYFGKGLPREWVASGQAVKIAQAPTRWGRVNFQLAAQPAAKTVEATVELARAGAPKELHVKLRMPADRAITSATVNGQPATIGGPHRDTVIVPTGTGKRFAVVGRYS